MINIITILLIFYFLYFYIKKYEIREPFANKKFIITKDDAIKHLAKVLSKYEASILYKILFIDKNDSTVLLSQLYSNIDINQLLCDIINDRGKYNKLQWLNENGLSIDVIKKINKGRLQFLYNFNPLVPINFLDIFNTKINNIFITCDIIDILKYNKFDAPIFTIINRHPILKLYKKKIFNILKSKNENFNINMKKSEFIKNIKLDKETFITLKPNTSDALYIDYIINSINNTLLIDYDDTISINQLFSLPQFVIYKYEFINSLIILLNRLILFISPNYDYNEDELKTYLLNLSIFNINELINSIRFIKDLNYLNYNLNNGIIEILNILYKKKDNNLNTINDIKIIKDIRTLVFWNHPDILPSIIIHYVNINSKISDLSDILLYGSYN
jgi:hypothetical protein